MATTTPNYGWDVPTSTDYVAQGAVAIETLGDDIDATLWTALGGAYPGLRLVKKQTIGSGVSSVSVTDAFSATYENYRIIISGGSPSADTYLKLQLGASATGYYGSMWYNTAYTSTTLTIANNNNTTSWEFAGEGHVSQFIAMNVDLLGPNLAKYTRMGTNFAFQSNSGIGIYNGYHRVATAYTGFTVTPISGTLTGGTIYVYGYGAS
jgi:hypothetical protein